MCCTAVCDGGLSAIVEAMRVNPNCKLHLLLTTRFSHAHTIRLMRSGSEGGLAIAEAIRVNRTMTALDLQRNNLGETAVIAVANARLSNPVLETVNLEWNVDTDEGSAVESHVDVVPHEVGCLVHPYAAIVLPHVCDDVCCARTSLVCLTLDRCPRTHALLVLLHGVR